MIIDGFKNRRDLVSQLEKFKQTGNNESVKVMLPEEKGELEVYPASLRKSTRGGVFLAGNYNLRNALFILGKSSLKIMQEYEGRIISMHSDFVIKKCRWIRSVTQRIQRDFPFCAPIGKQEKQTSIAFHDVFGIAAKAQLKAFNGKADLVLTRQSVHQLYKLERRPEDALDTVVSTVFKEGYKKGYAAEVCHLFTPEELRLMLKAGYTRFSVEAAESGLFALREEPKDKLLERMFEVPWIALRDKFELMFNRYKGIRIDLSTFDLPGFDDESESAVIIPTEEEVLSTIRIFGPVIVQLVEMERVLVAEKLRDDVTLEVSFALSEGTLTPFEHYFLMNELLRHDVHPDFLAPGELTPEHWMVAKHIGGYGLSGPARFLKEQVTVTKELKQHFIYPDISYISALTCIVQNKPALFREIWEMSRNRFEEVRKETRTEIDIHQIPKSHEMSDDELPELLQHELAEEFLTLTMEQVLTLRDQHGNRYIRRQLFDYFHSNEEICTKALLNVYSEWAADFESACTNQTPDR